MPFIIVARGKEITQLCFQGFFGFLINLAGFLQIKVTSPVTHMVSSAARGVLQTFVAMAIFGEIVSSKRWFGIVLTVGGSALYTWVRHQEVQETRAPETDEENPGMEETEALTHESDNAKA